MKAIWNNQIIAESKDVVMSGRECYFPFESLNVESLKKNKNIRYCYAKGSGSYFDLMVGGKVLCDGAWMYPRPYWEAEAISGMISFSNDVLLSE